MKRKERLALALVGIGVFSVDDVGVIWRHRDGATPIRPRRADTGRSKKSGYRRLQFTLNGVRYAVGAHRIVWMVKNSAFIPKGMEVNHIDGVKHNNQPWNLELLTHAENTLHSFRELGRRVKDQSGVKNSGAKLDEAKVLEIRSLCAAKALPQSVIATRFGVTQRTVSEIHLRKTWKHVPESTGSSSAGSPAPARGPSTRRGSRTSSTSAAMRR